MSTSLSTKVLSKSKYYICIHVALKNLEPHVPKFHTIHTFGQLKSHATIFFSGHMTRTLPSFFKDAMSYNFATMGRNQKKPNILMLKHFIFFTNSMEKWV